MFQDIRVALRMLLRAKGFALAASLTLALGIGLATAVFSIVNGALLRPLPYRDPARLVEILDQALHERGNNKLFATYADYREYSRHARTLESIAAVTWALKNPILTGRGEAYGVTAIPVSGSFFDLLGAHAQLGRTFRAADESGGCAAVLAHSFWTNKFGADPAVPGQTIALDGKPCVILGVMPKEFAFYPSAAQLWTLILPSDPDAEKMLAIGIGRLKPGVTPEQVQADLAGLFAALHTNDQWREFGPAVDWLQPELRWLAGRNLETTLWILLAAVGLVLSIACVNVANLLLGRALGRGREFAVRMALGGGRGRLFRQLLAEALPLAALGGALGVWIAHMLVRYFRSVNPVELPVGADISIDWRVLLFALAASAIAAVTAGTAPSWKAARTELNTALKNAGRGTVRGAGRAGRSMVTAEVAFSVVLLVGAGLLIESVLRMGSADLGFRPEGITVARITLPENRYRDEGARWRFYDSLQRQIAALPGVESAAITSTLPPASGGMDTLEISGQSFDPKHAPHNVTTEFITPDYFRAMGTSVLSGGFTSLTAADRAPEVLINEALAAEYFPAGHVIGSRIRVGGEREPWLTVTGIVATERRSTVYNEMQWVAQPAVYRLADQKPPMAASIVARTRGEGPLATELRRIAGSIDSAAALGQVETMRHALGTYLSYPRFRALVFGGFALFALLLAAVGLHGVLTELVTQRTQEIGIRMALGAKAADVARLVARDGAAPVLGGLAIGIACALLLGSVLSAMLYGVGARDLATVAGVSGVLLAAVALALALPARRAMRVDPMEALKEIG